MKNTVIIIMFMSSLLSCEGGINSSDQSSRMDWPLFRGNAALNGYTDVRLPSNPELLWTFKTNKRTVSSPTVLNGTVFWCDRFGLIRGVDLNGELTFEYDLKTAVEATPMIYDSVLYIGRIDGRMTAISLTERDTIWNYETLGQISASPNLMTFANRQSIVFGSYDNHLYCVDAKTGEELNSFESGYYLNGAAALWKDHVIFGGCDSWVRIINCRTGIQTDSLLLDAYIPASPAIIGNYCYIGDYSGNIYEILLEDGKFIRNKKIVDATDEGGTFVSVPAVSSENFFFLSSDRHINMINRKNGELTWKYMLKGDVGESSPLIAGDKVIVCTKTGIISILDVKDGKLLWEYDAGEQIIGSPAVIHNHFFVLTSRGTLLCFGEANK